LVGSDWLETKHRQIAGCKFASSAAANPVGTDAGSTRSGSGRHSRLPCLRSATGPKSSQKLKGAFMSSTFLDHFAPKAALRAREHGGHVRVANMELFFDLV
jgi:hypothetical protein